MKEITAKKAYSLLSQLQSMRSAIEWTEEHYMGSQDIKIPDEMMERHKQEILEHYRKEELKLKAEFDAL